MRNSLEFVQNVCENKKNSAHITTFWQKYPHPPHNQKGVLRHFAKNPQFTKKKARKPTEKNVFFFNSLNSPRFMKILEKKAREIALRKLPLI